MAGRTGRRRKQQSSKNPVTGMRNMQPVTGFLLARWYFVPTPAAGATIRLTGRTPSRGSQPAACQPEPRPGRRCRTASAPAAPSWTADRIRRRPPRRSAGCNAAGMRQAPSRRARFTRRAAACRRHHGRIRGSSQRRSGSSSAAAWSRRCRRRTARCRGRRRKR